MPNGYIQIPDWFSFENEGGEAVANLTGGANQDLVVKPCTPTSYLSGVPRLP
jgi:hypothetical protein